MVRGGGGAGYGGGRRGSSTAKDSIIGGGGGTINDALNALDEEMLRDFQEYSEAISEYWDRFDGNPGQMQIVKDHIIPVSFEHIGNAEEQWPWSSDPDEYLEELFGCFDEDVLARAFGDAFQEIYDTVSEFWLDADARQSDHDDILGFSAVHSTNPPWTA